MPCETGESSRKTRQKIGDGEPHRTHKPFCRPTQSPEHKHIHADMDDAKMQEHARQKSPPFPVHGARTEVGTPAQQCRSVRLHEIHTRPHHQSEDADIGDHDDDRHDGHRRQTGQYLNVLISHLGFLQINLGFKL